MMKYLATTPNPRYEGKVYGIRFSGGKALFDENTLDKSLGWRLEDIVRHMRELGYTVVPADEEGKKGKNA